MRKRVVIDGTPDEVKVSCPVWRGGKSGDNLKGLPITIGHHLRRFLAPEQNGGRPLRRPRQQDCPVWICQPGEREQPVLADDRVSAAYGRRAEVDPKGRVCGDEDGNASHAYQTASLSGLGDHL